MLYQQENFQITDSLLCEICLQGRNIPSDKFLSIDDVYKKVQPQLERIKNEILQEQLAITNPLKKILAPFKGEIKKILKNISVWEESKSQMNADQYQNIFLYLVEKIILNGNSTNLSVQELKYQNIDEIMKQNSDYILNLRSKCNNLFEFSMDIERSFIKIIQQQKQNQQEQQLINRVSENLQKMKSYIDQMMEELKQGDKENIKIEQQFESELTQQLCRSIAINKGATLMAASHQNDINLYELENGRIKNIKIIETGEKQKINTIVFSKKLDWLAAGTANKRPTIICLKREFQQDIWSKSALLYYHSNSIIQILLNKEENELYACSEDSTISVWRIDTKMNTIKFKQPLSKHTDSVCCISLNHSQNQLVSCSLDKQIILWEQGQEGKFWFKYKINQSVDDFGYRVFFISDEMIIWQQNKKAIAHVFHLENNVFKEKIEWKIQLKDEKCQEEDYQYFPPTYNLNKQVLLWKYGKFIILLQIKNKNPLKVLLQQFECDSKVNHGALDQEGKFFIFWDQVGSFKTIMLKQ